MKDSTSTLSEKTILAFLLILGAAFRFYDFGNIPFTHDEFSALFRTGYSSFNELIEKGVLVDFHPAGIQVFLHYYITLFGEQEWIVKLPFTLMGVSSIYLVYKIGKEWFNSKTGLLAAAFISSTQYFIFYSQIARPYIAGLFFGLLALLYWKRFLFNGKTASFKAFVLWIVFAALCAYIHYYLLLSLIILSIIGLFIVPKSRRPLYALSGIGIFILYLPHLNLFLKQLSKGGVESWLGKPDPDFLKDFGYYLFEYSTGFILIIASLILVGLISCFSKVKIGKLWWVSFLFFSISFATGYYYSVHVNAILQFSGLIFSVPLLLLALFYLMSHKNWIFYPALFSLLLFGSYGLIFQRNHYSILYESPYREITKKAMEAMIDSKVKPLIILDNRKDVLSYYCKGWKKNSDFIFLTDNTTSTEEFDEIFKNSDATHLALGLFVSSPSELLPIAQHYFPFIEERESYYHGEYYLLSKKGTSSINITEYETSLSFNAPIEPNYWSEIVNKSIFTDTVSGEKYTLYNDDSPNPISLLIPHLDQFPHYSNEFIDLRAEIEWDESSENTHLAIAIYQGTEIINWETSPLHAFGETHENKHWVFHSFPLNAVDWNQKDLSLKAFIYNPDKLAYKLYQFKAKIRKGNPKLYGLYKPLIEMEF